MFIFSWMHYLLLGLIGQVVKLTLMIFTILQEWVMRKGGFISLMTFSITHKYIHTLSCTHSLTHVYAYSLIYNVNLGFKGASFFLFPFKFSKTQSLFFILFFPCYIMEQTQIKSFYSIFFFYIFFLLPFFFNFFSFSPELFICFFFFFFFFFLFFLHFFMLPWLSSPHCHLLSLSLFLLLLLLWLPPSSSSSSSSLLLLYLLFWILSLHICILFGI